MIDTSRIRSGFDVEFQLGRRWFLTALNGLAERGVLIPPGTIPFLADDAVIEVTDVEIIFDVPGQDLQIEILIGNILPVPFQASIGLSDDGSELILVDSLTSNMTRVPFGVLSGLAGPPQLVKLPGDDAHENVFVLLANLDLRVSAQSADPLPAGEHVARGDADNAMAFLPTDKAVALGVASATLDRFANDIWHNQLTDNNGNHPFPDADNPQGDWRSVSMRMNNGRIRVVLRAVAEVDTPLIDIIPDPDITVTVDLTPTVVAGRLNFQIDVDTNIDFGLLGDLLAGLVGGIIGFVIGLFTGNPIGGAITGAAVGVIVLEVGEYIAGEVIEREIRARINGEPLTQFFACRNDLVQLATVRDQGQGLNLGFLDALPTSIPIHVDEPDLLYERTVLVTNNFDDITSNTAGFAAEGLTGVGESYLPKNAALVDKAMNGDQLAELVYRRPNDDEQVLAIDDVLERADSDAIPDPFTLREPGNDDVRYRKQNGRIPVVCLHPTAIHRDNSVVTAIRFESGLELDVPNTIRLQDSGVLVLPGLQLIHPSSGRPYYRAAPDGDPDNNFESLPEF